MKLALAIALGGCATSYQSARLLDEGNTQVTIGVSRVQIELDEPPADGDIEYPIWFGDLQIRHGMTDRFEGGLRLTRTPSGSSLSSLSIDPKVALTARRSNPAISFAVPLSLGWSELGTSTENATLALSPSLFVGVDVTPDVELVFSPKVSLLFPEADSDNKLFGIGATAGLRVGDETRGWAVQPELGVLYVTREGAAGAAMLTIGLGIAVGN